MILACSVTKNIYLCCFKSLILWCCLLSQFILTNTIHLQMTEFSFCKSHILSWQDHIHHLSSFSLKILQLLLGTVLSDLAVTCQENSSQLQHLHHYLISATLAFRPGPALETQCSLKKTVFWLHLLMTLSFVSLVWSSSLDFRFGIQLLLKDVVGMFYWHLKLRLTTARLITSQIVPHLPCTYSTIVRIKSQLLSLAYKPVPPLWFLHPLSLPLVR